MLESQADSTKERGSGVHASSACLLEHQAADEEGEGEGSKGNCIEKQLCDSSHFLGGRQAL